MDSVVRLKVENSEYDAKIKRAAQGLQHLEDACHKAGGTLAILDDADKKFVQSLGKMETVSKSARGSLNELSTAYTDLAMRYRRMSDEERNGDYGKSTQKAMADLRVRIREAKQELNGINKELGGSGGFTSMLEQLGGKLGINSDLMGLVTTGTVAYTAAIGAVVVAVEKAAEAWAKYNSEIAKQDQITTVTTGLKGADAEAMTDQVRAIAATYNVDFRDAINAANTLMTQFGASGQEALNLIKDGMQGMIAGDGPKLLQMIQQYAPAFRDAGIEASQLIAIIHNTEGGIFTDQNMNAIVMGIKNIRMMKDTTKEAMNSIGIDADSIAKKLNDGTMSVFEALRKVSGKIEEVGSGSQAAGEIMNDIFGKQGVAAGTNLGKAIETLNLNLDETKLQTDKVGSAMAELQTANEQLNTQIRKTFGYKGWEEMEIGLKVNLVNAVTNVLTAVEKLENAFKSCKSYYDKFESAVSQSKVASVMNTIYNAVLNAVVPFKQIYEYVYKIFSALGQTPNVKVPAVPGGGAKATGGTTGGGSTGGGNSTSGGGRSGDGGGTGSNSPAGSIGYMQKQLSELQAAYKNAATDGVRASLKEQITKLAAEINMMQNPLIFKTKFMTEDEQSKYLIEVLKKNETGSVSLELGLAGRGASLGDLQKAMGFGDQGDGLKTFTDFDFAREKWKKEHQPKEEKANALEESKNLVADISEIGSGLKSLGLDLGKGFDKTMGVVQGIMTITQGVQTVLGVIQAFNTANETAQAVLLATIATNTSIMAANSFSGWIPFFANGGVVRAASGFVGGNKYSGDNIPALLNSGETVLNAAQTSNLATKLNNNAEQRMSAQPYLDCEKLYLGLNTFLGATGRGEILTTRG